MLSVQLAAAWSCTDCKVDNSRVLYDIAHTHMRT